MENDDEILVNLEKIGFSDKEAKVFLELVKNPASNGSKIAKILRYPRTTIYQILTNLQLKGYVRSFLDKEITLYEIADVDNILNSYKKDVIDATNCLKESLRKVRKKPERKQFYNLNSYENVKEKIREIIKNTKKSLYINTNLDLSEFKDDFDELKKRGIKPIFFTFDEQDYSYLDIDIFKRDSFDKGITEEYGRIMIAGDNKVSIIGSDYNDMFSGVYSENKLLVNLVLEHIKNDINILLLEEKYGKDINQHMRKGY